MKKLLLAVVSLVMVLSLSTNINALEDIQCQENTNLIDNDQEIINEEVSLEAYDLNKSVDKEKTVSLEYQTHVQDIGWQSVVTEGNTAGTTGKKKRLEGIKINLKNNGSYTGDIQYRTHVQEIGWQDWVCNGAMSGTEGKSYRLEAIQIKLTEELADNYDIYYRVHAQEYGWLDWAKNGEMAGTAGYSYRLEAIEIKLVEKGGSAPGSTATPYHQKYYIGYKTHIQDIGWQNKAYDGALSGTTGKAKRLEGIQIKLENPLYEGKIEYRTHIQDIGWETSWASNGATSGTTGKAKRLEAIEIRLKGEMAERYDIYYRVHAQDYGWLGWASNGASVGTEGLAKRLEAIQIKLVEKGGTAPGSTEGAFIKPGDIKYQTKSCSSAWKNEVNNGTSSGSIGKTIESMKFTLGNNDYNGNVEYSSHVQDIGWTDYVKNGEISGTIDQSKSIEAIKIKITGDISKYYDIYYRVYSSCYGWLDWARNDAVAGTTGGSFGIELIQVKLLPKRASITFNTQKTALSFTNSNGLLICKNANGNVVNDIESYIGKQSSYVLRVNKATNVVTVLVKNGNGTYNVAYKRFVCSVGNATPIGIYYTPAKYRWHTLMGPSYGQWCTRIVDGILFHSVYYSKMDNRTLSVSAYNKLGTTASHGCVRLTCGDAKWIYDNCALKTQVIIISSGPDPLSKPSAAKLPSWHTWDPTDPTI